MVLTNEDLICDVTDMLKSGNCSLQIDATGGLVVKSGGVEPGKVYLYVVMAVVPSISGPAHSCPFALLVCTDHHASHLSNLLGTVMAKIREKLNGNQPQFTHLTTDNCGALRQALALQLNGLSTMEMMRKASRILEGECTVPEVEGFVPFHCCIAHQIKSDYDYCKKHKIGGLQKYMFLRVRTLMQTLTSKEAVENLVYNYLSLLSRYYDSPVSRQAFKAVAEICGFELNDKMSAEEFLNSVCEDEFKPDLVSRIKIDFKINRLVIVYKQVVEW